MNMLNQYPKVPLIEILKQQHKKSYIKNVHGAVNVEAFIATMALIKETDGMFVQRAELVYKVQEDGSFKPVYILGTHEETLDVKGYAELFGLKKASVGGETKTEDTTPKGFNQSPPS